MSRPDKFDRRLAQERARRAKTDPWKCRVCQETFVVPELARIHEKEHQ